jgi:hypothetical protein
MVNTHSTMYEYFDGKELTDDDAIKRNIAHHQQIGRMDQKHENILLNYHADCGLDSTEKGTLLAIMKHYINTIRYLL